MNDRFKFRVFSKNINGYIIGTMLVGDGGEMIYDVSYECCNTNQGDYIIEQCTGLKDKNGNLIYEGDIVLFNDDDYPWQIKWNEVFARWVLYSPLGSNEDGEEELTDTDTEYLKIIGNIHEQAEQKD